MLLLKVTDHISYIQLTKKGVCDHNVFRLVGQLSDFEKDKPYDFLLRFFSKFLIVVRANITKRIRKLLRVKPYASSCYVWQRALVFDHISKFRTRCAFKNLKMKAHNPKALYSEPAPKFFRNSENCKERHVRSAYLKIAVM